ncbi:MAG: hypothetical protein ACLSG1_06580 [Anaerotignum faecicola]
MGYCFGIDIGGTTVKIGLAAEDGTLLEGCEIPTRREPTPEGLLLTSGCPYWTDWTGAGQGKSKKSAERTSSASAWLPWCGDGGWHPAWRGQYRLGRCGTCERGRAHHRHFTRLRWE